MSFAFDCRSCGSPRFGEVLTGPLTPGSSDFYSQGPCPTGYRLIGAGTRSSYCAKELPVSATITPSKCPAGFYEYKGSCISTMISTPAEIGPATVTPTTAGGAATSTVVTPAAGGTSPMLLLGVAALILFVLFRSKQKGS